MNYIVYINILIIITILFIFTTCGIEDSIYIQEPEYLNVENDDSPNVRLRFSGFNQEKDMGRYLFIGYDVYYYFSNRNDAKMACVYIPFRDEAGTTTPFDPIYPLRASNNNKLMYFPNNDFGGANDRFPEAFYPKTMRDFYQLTTFPVTEDMITNVLRESRNDNVQLGFEIEGANGLRDVIGGNPYNNNQHIFLGAIFPNYSEYYDKEWGIKQTQDIINAGEISSNTRIKFRGFYDKDFYYHRSPKISPISGEEENDTSGICKYRVYFYVIAKGFNSDHERNRSFAFSEPSNTVAVIFEVNNNTLQKNLN